MNYHRSGIYAAVDRERAYQDRKYGPHHDRELSVGDFLIILQTELDEAKREYVRNGVALTLAEVLQVAAVAVACMEQHGYTERA